MFPASLGQRFSAAILDIGLLIFALIVLNIAFKLLNGIPIEFARPRYRPPEPDMGWEPIQRSLMFTAGTLAMIAAFIASPLRATPGMTVFFLRVSYKTGERLSFLRAFLWALSAYLPVLTANYLVLFGIAANYPVININTLSLFNLMIFLQSIWFLPALFRKDKRTFHDIALNAKVDYYDARPEGLHLIRRIFMTLMVGIALVVVSITGSFSLINLKDASPDPLLAVLEEMNVKEPPRDSAGWRETAGAIIEENTPDFRCAARATRFHKNLNCPASADLQNLVAQHRSKIDIYLADINAPKTFKSRTHEKYLNFENVGLTDLTLSDLLIQQNLNADEGAFEKWLKLANFWNQAIEKPGLMLSQSKALMHLNHVLLALPVILSTEAGLPVRHEQEIRNILTPLNFDSNFVNGLMAREYAHYNRVMRWSMIDYFPLIQPNHTRNQFAEAAKALTTLFDLEASPSARAAALNVFERRSAWNTAYNPLGLVFRDLALQNMISNLHIISTYHHNNALKKMLLIYLDAVKAGVPREKMQAYLDSLSENTQKVILEQKAQWDPAAEALYYTLPGSAGYRRLMPI